MDLHIAAAIGDGLHVFSAVIAGGGSSGGIVGNGVNWVNGCTDDAQCLTQCTVNTCTSVPSKVQAGCIGNINGIVGSIQLRTINGIGTVFIDLACGNILNLSFFTIATHTYRTIWSDAFKGIIHSCNGCACCGHR